MPAASSSAPAISTIRPRSARSTMPRAGVTQAIIPLQRLQEAYPDLKSNQNFLTLQSQIEGTENSILVARRDYNEAVQAYNTRIRTFPDAIGAKIFYGAKPKVPFEAAAGAQDAPKVDFKRGLRSSSQRHAREAGVSVETRPGSRFRWDDDWLLAALLAAAPRPLRRRRFRKLTGRVVDQADLLTPGAGSRSDAQIRSAGGADRAAIRRRDRQQPRGADDRGLWLSARPRLGDRPGAEGRRRHPAGRAQRAKVRIETGYGARVFLTDAVSSVIIRECDPAAVQGRRHWRRDRRRRRPDHQDDELPPPKRSASARRSRASARSSAASSRRQSVPGHLHGVIIFFVIIGSMSARRRPALSRGAAAISPGSCCGASMSSAAARGGGGWWRWLAAAAVAFGGGGGGFSGGGGSFGGGGASGGW